MICNTHTFFSCGFFNFSLRTSPPIFARNDKGPQASRLRSPRSYINRRYFFATGPMGLSGVTGIASLKKSTTFAS